MRDNILLRLAHLRVHDYADESTDLMKRHEDAMECRDCEDFLKKGIAASKFLRMTDDIFREADAKGLASYDDEIRNAVQSLYVAWFNPIESVENWVQYLAARDYVPDNLEEFRKTCEEMRELSERRDWQARATSSRVLSSAEESW
jgi:hypothetical protein